MLSKGLMLLVLALLLVLLVDDVNRATGENDTLFIWMIGLGVMVAVSGLILVM